MTTPSTRDARVEKAVEAAIKEARSRVLPGEIENIAARENRIARTAIKAYLAAIKEIVR